MRLFEQGKVLVFEFGSGLGLVVFGSVLIAPLL